VIFASFEAALLTQGNENGVKSTKYSQREACWVRIPPPYGRVTKLNTPVFAKDLAEKCKAAFGCAVVRYVDSGKSLLKIGVSSGSAEESVEAALNAGCDAFICGEVTHDRMLFAADHGLTLIEAGHFHTEDIFCDDLVERLKSKFK